MTFMPFLKAHEERVKEEREKIDWTAWLHGHYVLRAIGAAISNKVSYPQSPVSITEPPKANESVSTMAENMRIYALGHNRRLELRKGGKK